MPSPPLSRHVAGGGVARVHPPGLPSEERKILSCHGVGVSPATTPTKSTPNATNNTLATAKKANPRGGCKGVAPLALNKSVLLSLRVIVIIGLVVGLSCGEWVKPRSRVFEG